MDHTTDTARRRAAPASLDVLDTEAEAAFDAIVEAASAVCGMPISLISLLDTDRQWFKAEIGSGLRGTPLAASICTAAAAQAGLLEIPDTTEDPRTAGNPLVTGSEHVRFYAGVPLVTGDGVALGALCVLDTRPNRLTAAQSLVLRTLARQAMTALELRRALAERRETDRRNAAILTSAIGCGLVSMDLRGLVTSWNAGAERILGWSEAAMRGRPAHLFFTPEDVADAVPEAERADALAHGRATDERWYLRQDGTRVWAQGETMPLRDEGGRPEGFIKILRDRTEQRLAALALRDETEFMRSVLAASADCIKVLDLDARLTYMTEGGMAAMEISDFNDVKGCPWPDFWQDQGNVAANAAIEAARAGGTGHFQGAAETFLGTPRWWDVQVTPIRDAAGAPAKLLAVSRDITGQKTTERALAVSEARWRGLFTGMQEGFFLGELVRDAAGVATDCRFLTINPAFARQSGLPVDSIGRTLRDFVPDIDQGLIDAYARVVETGEPTLMEIDVPGLDRSFEVRASKDQDERFVCLFLDITARKQNDLRREATTELGDRLRDVDDKAEIGRVAAEIMGRTLGLSHAGYGQVDSRAETILVAEEWIAPGLAGLAGLHQFRAYGSYIDDLKAGRNVVIPDTFADPRTARDAAALAGIGVRALLNLPVMEHGRFVGLFYVAKARPRAWTAEDIGFVRNVADRTRAAIARIEAEEQQQVVNLELSHRLKNTLTLVQSIASQTLRNAPDVGHARDVLGARLIALGKAHDILLSGRSDSAGLSAVIEAALSLHRDGPQRLRLSGPDLTIGPSAALSLGLILHELATNAAKYGALSRPGGFVALAWAVHGQGRDARFELVWSEHGGPAVTPPSRSGFGSRLIQRGLSGGTVTTLYRPEGVTCTLTTPVDDLRAEA